MPSNPTSSTSQEAPRAEFSAMCDSTQEDWNRIVPELIKFNAGLPDRVMAHLRLLDGDYGGFKVDRLTHSLQTATRAYRANRDDDYIVCALIHDIGDSLASYNHADIAAAILKPFVNEGYHWMIENHTVFQGYYFFDYVGRDNNERDKFAGHPYFDLTAEFCADFDGPSFEPDYPTMKLEEFEPLLRTFFANPKYLRS